MRMRIGSVAVATIAMVALASSAVAHEGHGDPAWYGSVLHYLTEPVHLPLTLAVLVALVLATRLNGRTHR